MKVVKLPQNWIFATANPGGGDPEPVLPSCWSTQETTKKSNFRSPGAHPREKDNQTVGEKSKAPFFFWHRLELNQTRRGKTLLLDESKQGRGIWGEWGRKRIRIDRRPKAMREAGQTFAALAPRLLLDAQVDKKKRLIYGLSVCQAGSK